MNRLSLNDVMCSTFTSSFIASAILAVTFLANASCALGGEVEEILSNTLVKSTYELMDIKNSGSCKMPVKDDISWYCGGALPPLGEPTLISIGCGFSVVIRCQSEEAVLSGSYGSVMLHGAGSLDSKVEPFNLGVNFYDMEVIVRP